MNEDMVRRRASPDPSPAALLTRTLDARLRSERQALFAGLAVSADGTVEVFAVGSDPGFAELVNGIRLATAPNASVRIAGQRSNSLATLESVRDQITARRDAMAALGITILEWGVDVHTNKVRVGVLNSTSQAAALLAQEFGADRIDVVQGQMFSGTAKAVPDR